HFILVEADCLAAARDEDDLALAIGYGYTNEAVIVGQVHGDDSAGARPREGRQGCFLYRALARRHEYEVLLVILFDGQQGVDFLAFLQWEEIHHGLAS